MAIGAKRYYHKTRKEYKRVWVKQDRAKTRRQAIAKLGNRCVRCSNSDQRVLQFDHIDGGGTQEYFEGRDYHSFVKSIVDGLRGIQLLCANCNFIKKEEKSEKPAITSQRHLKFRVICQEQRNKAIDLLGGKCNSCGFFDRRALQFDHIFGNKTVERTDNVISRVLCGANDIQLLCANCNWIKELS